MKYWWNMAVLVVSMISKENTKWIVNFFFPFTEIHNDFREVVSNSLLMNQLFQLYWGFYGRKSQIKFLKYSNTKRVPKLCQTWTITLHWDNSKLFIHAFKLYGKVCPIDFHKKEDPGSCYHILFVATSICIEQIINVTDVPSLWGQWSEEVITYNTTCVHVHVGLWDKKGAILRFVTLRPNMG